MGTHDMRRALELDTSKVDSLDINACGGQNLVVRVDRIMAIAERVREDGTRSKVADVVVGDETGCVTLTARNDQIDVLIPNTVVALNNCQTKLFQGSMRVQVDRWGSIVAVGDGEPREVNCMNDKSAIEWTPV